MIVNGLNTVKDYALKYLWANPHADKQTLFKTVRLSPIQGSVSYLKVSSFFLYLPLVSTRYHVYEIGLLDPFKIGINLPFNTWVPYNTFINNNKTLIFAFIKGRMVNFDNAYIIQTSNKSIIFAIDYNKNNYINNFDEDLYIRFYTNLFYIDNPSNKLLDIGTFFNTNSQVPYHDFISFINQKISDYQVNPILFLNGFYLPDGIPIYYQIKINDRIDYVFDPCIKNKADIEILNAPFFNSSLDNCRKIITSIDIIDDGIFTDDIEYFISGQKDNGLRIGVYYARLHPFFARLLTFKDFSLHSDFITLRQNDLISLNTDNLSNFKIHLIRRDNGQPRPKVLDNNRILDLMNLPYDKRIQALTGINANLPIWQADNLEKSNLNLWIAKEGDTIINEPFISIVSRYGAIDILERVKKIYPNTLYSLPPIISNGGGKLLKYDSNGLNPSFINYNSVSNVNQFYPNGKGVEILIPGLESNLPLDIEVPVGTNSYLLDNNTFDIFCYYKDSHNNLIYAIYNVDYTLIDGINNSVTINFSQSLTNLTKYIRVANRCVSFTKTITLDDIRDGINIYTNQILINDIGMETLMVWINGYYQVEDLDYKLYKGKIYITENADYLLDTSVITVLYMGLPDKSLHKVNNSLWGFIKFGSIINNNFYDLFMYRNDLFFVEGKATTIEQIKNAEGYVDKSTTNEINYRDGLPFAIIKPPTYSRSDKLDTFTLTKLSDITTDSDIITFLNAIDPQHQTEGFVLIPNKYKLVSTLINKLIDEIIKGYLLVPNQHYNEINSYEMIIPYLDYLHIDPARDSFEDGFVTILPRWVNTPVNVNIHIYNFLDIVNKTFLNDKVFGLNLYLHVI